MKIKKVLLVYKKSVYKIYFLERHSSYFGKQRWFPAAEIVRLRAAHRAHYQSLEHIEKVLKSKGIKYQKICRGRKVDAAGFDLVVTVGGDGTFLEAARAVKSQLVLGINSDPARSIGRFCPVRKEAFARLLDKILSGDIRFRHLHRLRLTLIQKKKKSRFNILNDILICHSNPAAISRYYLTIDGVREEQRGSGIWISTAAGSSGAIQSAGGRALSKFGKGVQYRPRELYFGFNPHYRHKGGIVFLQKPMTVESVMRNGRLYIDGAHLKLPFEFGDKAVFTHSPEPIRSIEGR